MNYFRIGMFLALLAVVAVGIALTFEHLLRMTMHINSDWKRHVHNTGVTCWTCHRGNHVPAQKWAHGAFIAGDFFATELPQTGMDRGRAGQNAPSEAAASASLPYNPYTPYLDRGKM